MRQITKAGAYTVTVEIPDELLAILKGDKDITEKALMAGAEYWRTGILPGHFKEGAAATYGYAPRVTAALKAQRGKPDLVSSYSLKNDITRNAIYTPSRNSIKLKMWARVLNLVPNMAENNPSITVRQRSGRQYPNLKREIKAVTMDDRESVAQVVAGTIANEYAKAMNQASGVGGKPSITQLGSMRSD